MTREYAVKALIEITENKGYNSIVLRKYLSDDNLSVRDKAFITEIVNGCLRNLIYLDYVINSFSKTQTKKMKPFILAVLRVCVYQLIFMDKTPAHAACNEAIILVKKRGFTNLAPFVNGVLRNISRGWENVEMPKDKAESISVKYSCPKWIVDYWLTFLDFDTVVKMAEANIKRPEVSIAVNTLKTTKAELINLLTEENVEVLDSNSDGVLYISHTSDITSLKCYQQGLFFVVDTGAFEVVNKTGIKPGATVMDVCAAPGGKSFLSAIQMENKGRVLSFDIHEHKIKLIENTAERLGINIIEASINDGCKVNEKYENSVDYLILDAPCSGLGVLKKKPDIKYTKTMEDVKSLGEIQRQMLSVCQGYIRQGGILTYSTCTVSSIENQQNIEWFLKNYNYKLITLYDKYLPHLYRGDGFFIAIMEKL